jgi:hypothetical protein
MVQSTALDAKPTIKIGGSVPARILVGRLVSRRLTKLRHFLDMHRLSSRAPFSAIWPSVSHKTGEAQSFLDEADLARCARPGPCVRCSAVAQSWSELIIALRGLHTSQIAASQMTFLSMIWHTCSGHPRRQNVVKVPDWSPGWWNLLRIGITASQRTPRGADQERKEPSRGVNHYLREYDIMTQRECNRKYVDDQHWQCGISLIKMDQGISFGKRRKLVTSDC